MRSVPLPGTRFSGSGDCRPWPSTNGVHDSPAERPKTHLRRRRYAGKNPREYHEKYKELNSAQYPGEVEKVLAACRWRIASCAAKRLNEPCGTTEGSTEPRGSWPSTSRLSPSCLAH